MRTGMEYCGKSLAGPTGKAFVWMDSLVHCGIHEMIRDDPQNPDDLKKTGGTLVILKDKPDGAVAKPTMAELNKLIKNNEAAPFASGEDGYFYIRKASPFDTVEKAKENIKCPGYE